MFEAPQFLRPRKIARLLGVTNRTIVNYMNNGTLKAIQINKRTWRIPAVEYERFIREREVATEQAIKERAAAEDQRKLKSKLASVGRSS